MNGLNLWSGPLGWLARDWEAYLGNGDAAWIPAMDIREDENGFALEVDVPGMKPEDIELTFSEDRLTLRGQRKAETPEGATLHRRERVVGAFERTIGFSKAVDGTKVEASFKNGVLTITLPKAEAAKPHRVSVKYQNPN